VSTRSRAIKRALSGIGWLAIAVTWGATAASPGAEREAAPESAAAPMPRPFTVADSIEWTHILDANGALAASDASTVAVRSHNGARFLIRLRRGDLRKNANIETLAAFSADELASYLAADAQGTPPRPRTIAEREVTEDWGDLADAQWVGDSQVAFTAQAGGTSQIFLTTLATGEVRQLTHHATSVVAFGVGGDRVVFYAHVSRADPGYSVVIDKQDLFGALGPETEADLPVELFQLSLKTGETRRIAAPPALLLDFCQRIWVAPSGTHAVTFEPATDAPRYWAEYRIPNYEMFGYTPELRRSDPASPDLLYRTRYRLIDLERNSARTLLDAPSGMLSQNMTPLEVFWPGDGRSVIVSNTYLPLGTPSPHDPRARDERARRTRGPAIAEVDLRSGAVEAVTYEPVLTEQQIQNGTRLEPIVSIDWNAARAELSVVVRDGDGGLHHMTYAKRRPPDGSRGSGLAAISGSSWRGGAVVPFHEPSAVTIEVGQSLSERPRLYARGGACHCRKLLLDPDPQADHLTFGRVESLEWTDEHGASWRAGLVYPTSYVPGRRFPLVVQTHGFSPREFLLDGPDGTTTSMSAQALANAGFLVLQIRESRAAITLDEREGALVAAGYKAGIEQLISRGLVEPGHVGVIGFSRTGNYVVNALARYPDLFAAADIASATQPGYVQYLTATINSSPDSARQQNALSGGAPPVVGYGKWFDASPLYQLARTHAAIRLEAIGSSDLIDMWETYGVLRETNRVVDLVYFPRGSHVLQKPAERLASQGGAVDWFRFWLEGCAEAPGGDEPQYQRWRELRRRALKDETGEGSR
jgi:hypothetical protein